MAVKTNFPVVPLDEVPTSVPPNGPQKHRPVVLVVDDESAIADTLAEILSLSGYAAMPVYDGEEALETALLTPPELLITDVMLPGMSGIELAITMRRIFPDCRVLLFSGQAATTDLLLSAKRSGHEFTMLSKPVYPTDLLRRVSESFDSTRSQSSARS
ncbi:MAG TPA: response regulator [Terracidiphilus sp.]|jgi:CheY-like chemotaxis protein